MNGKPSYCSVKCKSEYQRTQKPVTKEWLYQKYIVEGLDCNEISKIVGRDSKRVWEWIRDYGIETRKRGKTDNWKHSIGVQRVLSDEGRQRLSENAKRSRALDGRVPYLQNGVHHLKGKRGKDTPNWKGGVTGERQAVYGTLEWKAAVKAVWIRDNATCKRCGKYHNTDENRGTFDIHHIIPFEVKELRCDVNNLVLLCESCHYFVHSKSNISREFLP